VVRDRSNGIHVDLVTFPFESYEEPANYKLLLSSRSPWSRIQTRCIPPRSRIFGNRLFVCPNMQLAAQVSLSLSRFLALSL